MKRCCLRALDRREMVQTDRIHPRAWELGMTELSHGHKAGVKTVYEGDIPEPES